MMKPMIKRRAATAAACAPTARETQPPPPGLEAAWEHPLLGRMLYGQRHHERMDQRYPWLLDTAVVVIVFLISLPDLLGVRGLGPFVQTGQPRSLTTGALLITTIALVVPLWWRRRAPATTFFIIALVSLAQWSMGIWGSLGASVLVALYTLASRGSLRALGWAAALSAVELTLAVSLLAPVEHPVFALFFLFGTATAAIATGLTARIRRMYQAALEDRARRLEVERDQRVRLTAAAERSRVAREMHDIVGHNLSVMVGLADGAAALATARGEQSAQALRLLGDTGRQAMGELRRVLGVLRGDQDDERMLNPQPAIRDLDPLLARVRAAGLAVSYRTSGDLDNLGDGVQLTVYRIVQEALTNTLKHTGPGTAAEVLVAAEGGEVHVRVTDTGTPPESRAPGDAQTPQSDEPRHGLVGIRQRAAMYGGSVTIGPRQTGPGWVVEVVGLDAASVRPHTESGELKA